VVLRGLASDHRVGRRDIHVPEQPSRLAQVDSLTHHLGVTRVVQLAALEPLAPFLDRLGPYVNFLGSEPAERVREAMRPRSTRTWPG
jgi:hypothetical protein